MQFIGKGYTEILFFPNKGLGVAQQRLVQLYYLMKIRTIAPNLHFCGLGK
jgi:hypothetical protein